MDCANLIGIKSKELLHEWEKMFNFEALNK